MVDELHQLMPSVIFTTLQEVNTAAIVAIIIFFFLMVGFWWT
jgi:hypothetical protein